MAFGLGVLRLAPRDFWAMSPRELAAAIRPRRFHGFGASLTRSELAELMGRYPDGVI